MDGELTLLQVPWRCGQAAAAGIGQRFTRREFLGVSWVGVLEPTPRPRPQISTPPTCSPRLCCCRARACALIPPPPLLKVASRAARCAGVLGTGLALLVCRLRGAPRSRRWACHLSATKGQRPSFAWPGGRGSAFAACRGRTAPTPVRLDVGCPATRCSIQLCWCRMGGGGGRVGLWAGGVVLVAMRVCARRRGWW